MPVFPLRALDSVGRILAAEQSGLPVLSDDTGRPMSWVYVTGEPGFYYMGDYVEIDESWIDASIASYEKMGRRGYESPVIAEHVSTDGRRLGDLVELRKTKIDGRFVLAGAVRWALPDAKEQIEAGAIRYFSPAIASIEDDESGEILTNVIAELSVVAAPHQKTAGTHVLAKQLEVVVEMEEQDAAVEATEAIEAEEQPVDALAELTAKVEALAEVVATLAGGDDAEAEEEEAKAEEDADEVKDAEMSEVAELRARLGELEVQRDAAIYRTNLPIGSTITLSEPVADLLFGLWRQDREAFQAAIGAAIQAPAAPRTEAPPVVSPWTVRLGETPGAASPAVVNDKEIYAQCLAEAGGDAVKANALYKNAKFGA